MTTCMEGFNKTRTLEGLGEENKPKTRIMLFVAIKKNAQRDPKLLLNQAKILEHTTHAADSLDINRIWVVIFSSVRYPADIQRTEYGLCHQCTDTAAAADARAPPHSALVACAVIHRRLSEEGTNKEENYPRTCLFGPHMQCRRRTYAKKTHYAAAGENKKACVLLD